MPKETYEIHFKLIPEEVSQPGPTGASVNPFGAAAGGLGANVLGAMLKKKRGKVTGQTTSNVKTPRTIKKGLATIPRQNVIRDVNAEQIPGVSRVGDPNSLDRLVNPMKYDPLKDATISKTETRQLRGIVDKMSDPMRQRKNFQNIVQNTEEAQLMDDLLTQANIRSFETMGVGIEERSIEDREQIYKSLRR